MKMTFDPACRPDICITKPRDSDRDQWECVETWLARARRSLGPKAWACLRSSDAFHRTRNRLWQSIVSGDAEYQASVSRGDRFPSPDASLPRPGRQEESEQAVPDPGSGRRAKERQDGAAATRLKQARRPGAIDRNRQKKAEAKNEEEEEDASGGCGPSSWDQLLAENGALAINAAMWTTATERERATFCATNGKDGGIPATNAAAQQQAARGTDDVRSPRAATGDANPARRTAVLELRVSLAAARRFVKSSRLIDGVLVLDADVDLAFKRWEEAGRLTERDRHCSVSTSIATSPSPVRRRAKGQIEASFADANVAVPVAQKLCEAVGCSDPALYSDVHPSAKATLCRKHRRNGMVDVGSRR